MATGQRVDPYGNFNFLVEIDGITRAAFHEVSGLRLDDRRDRAPRGRRQHHARKLPGQAKYSNITLKWGMTDDTRALRLAPPVGRRRSGGDAQERLDRPARPPGQGEGALELLQRLAGQVDRPELQRRGQRHRDRDARARPRRPASAPERECTGGSHVPDRVRVHPAAAATSTTRARCTATASCAAPPRPTRSCRCKDPRVQSNQAYLIVILLSRVVTRLGSVAADQPQGDRGPVRRPTWPILQDLYNRVNQLATTARGRASARSASTSSDARRSAAPGESSATPSLN